MSYDPDNIFAKIIRGEIPSKFLYDNGNAVAFDDIAPQASVHVLVIPKGQYESLTDFSMNATLDEMQDFYEAIAYIIKAKNLEKDGYRAICNTGENGGQEVPHFHMHIMGGEKLPPMLVK